MLIINKKKILFVICATILSFAFYGYNTNNEGINKDIVNTKLVNTIPVTNKSIIIDAGHGFPDERNSLLTLKNNIDLLQKIKCFKHFIFFMLKRRLIYAKQRIW